MRIDHAILSIGFRYFAAVADAGSIRAAARELNIASSAVNRQILLLEEALGLALFERLGRSLRLTEAGAILHAQVRATMRDYEDTMGAIDALRGLKRGRVRVATVESVSVSPLPGIVSSFRARFPGIGIDLTVAGSDAVTARVLAHEADLGFTFNPTSLDGLEVAFEKGMRIGALLAPDHPLAGRSELSLADCLAYPHAWPARGLSLRAALDAALGHLRPRPVLESNSLRVMSALARAGQLIAFQPRVGIEQHLETGALVFIPLNDPTLALDRLMLVRQQARAATPAAEAFFEHVIGVLGDQPLE
ncbi:MAG: LysR family transcriptional regulator [Hyphomicrobiales bacterium]